MRVREAGAKVKEKPNAGEKVSWTKGGPPALKQLRVICSRAGFL